MMTLGIIPDWPAPLNVRAWSSTRQGGVSQAPYGTNQNDTAVAGGLNFGTHVGDKPEDVVKNRASLSRITLGRDQTQTSHIPPSIHWLNQIHGTEVKLATHSNVSAEISNADASVSIESGQVCAVMTADCLPVLFCDRAGRVVGAAHAGWRGLLSGVLEATVRTMLEQEKNAQIMAWLGPAIGPTQFEVGAEVRDAFLAQSQASELLAIEQAFTLRSTDQGVTKYLVDIFALARLRLARVNVNHVYGGNFCTVNDPEKFYSYRRDGVTGRMVSLIYLI